MIRFLGLLNAAVWLGMAFFMTVSGGPAFFSEEMLSFLPRPYAGRAAEVILAHYHWLQQGCAGIALLHLLAEYLHAGRPISRGTVALLSLLLAASLFMGRWLEPKLHDLQRVRYSQVCTLEQKDAATAAFRRWHAAGRTMDVLVLAGVLWHFWRLGRPLSAPHAFPNLEKIRG